MEGASLKGISCQRTAKGSDTDTKLRALASGPFQTAGSGRGIVPRVEAEDDGTAVEGWRGLKSGAATVSQSEAVVLVAQWAGN
jgi:hypothetical protein